MKSLIIALSLVLVSIGCAALPKEYQAVGYIFQTTDVNCQELNKNIFEKWGNHREFENCYYYNQKLIDEIVVKNDCLLNLNQKEIKKIFGAPSITNKDNSWLRYNMSTSCVASDTLGFTPHSLSFQFKHNKLFSIQKGTLSVIN